MLHLLKLASFFYKTASLPSSVIAYHTGAMNLQGDMFSINHLGQGEGMAYLGPGTYFVTNKNLAKRYAKYRPNDATLYECQINTSRIYDPWKGIPENYRGTLQKMSEEYLKNNNLSKAPYTDNFKYGVFEIGMFHKLLGPQKSTELLKENGFSGFYQEIQPSIYEICVFNYSDVKILSKELLVDLEKIKLNKQIDEDKKVFKNLKYGDIFSCEFSDSSMNFIAKVIYANENHEIKFELIKGSNDLLLNDYKNYEDDNYHLWIDEKDFIDKLHEMNGKISLV